MLLKDMQKYSTFTLKGEDCIVVPKKDFLRFREGDYSESPEEEKKLDYYFGKIMKNSLKNKDMMECVSEEEIFKVLNK